jgi:virginiamycin B lyase
MRPSAGLAASLFLTVLALGGCGNGAVIGSGPLPTPTPITPRVTNEFSVPTANAQPSGIASGRDGFLYFTELNANNIGQVTTGGSMVEIGISAKGGTAGNHGVSIASGPDANLWFTEQGAAPGIASMALASHTVTEYHVPGSAPLFIGASPLGGSLIFTDPANNAIGLVLTGTAKFAPTGSVTAPPNCAVSSASANICEFSIAGLGGSANANPLSTTTLSNDVNNVYFTEYNTSRIGVLNVNAGTLTEIDTSLGCSANAGPTTIRQGPDGALWFTEANVGKMCRMTATGQLSEFALTPATSAATFISALDNNFYFEDIAQNKIGRMTLNPAGVTELDVSTTNAFAAPPTIGEMTIGPDGRVYFAETTGNKIGQINY